MKSRNAIANQARDQWLSTDLQLGCADEGERHAMNVSTSHEVAAKAAFSAIKRSKQRFLATGRAP